MSLLGVYHVDFVKNGTFDDYNGIVDDGTEAILSHHIDLFAEVGIGYI